MLHAYPELSKPSLYRWVSKLERGNHLYVDACNSGRKPVLSDEKWRIAVGYVLAQNRAKVNVVVLNVQAFLLDNFGVKVGRETIRKSLRERGIIYKGALSPIKSSLGRVKFKY